MTRTPNQSFIDELSSGKEHAYVLLVETYSRRLFAYAINLTGDYSLAQDILQNVFIKTWQYRHNLKAELSLSNFLYKSVYNEFLNQYKKSKAFIRLESKQAETLVQVLEEHSDEDLNEIVLKINRTIDQLPAECREIFLMGKKEGLTYPEIAGYKNISVKTVEAQMSKALKFLRTTLHEEMEILLPFVFYTRNR